MPELYPGAGSGTTLSPSHAKSPGKVSHLLPEPAGKSIIRSQNHCTLGRKRPEDQPWVKPSPVEREVRAGSMDSNSSNHEKGAEAGLPNRNSREGKVETSIPGEAVKCAPVGLLYL